MRWRTRRFWICGFRRTRAEPRPPPGWWFFQHAEKELYHRLVEAARNRWADLELEYGIEKSKVDAIRSKLFGALRTYYQ